LAGTPDICGKALPGYEPVVDAFALNFRDPGEIGAACCVYVDGEPVVDLWGGLADAGASAPWTDRTIVMVYSATKGLAAMCALLLAQRGELDLDRPVAAYWPEFAAGGKDRVTARQVLSHQAGLPVIDRTLTHQEVLDGVPVSEALAAQPPVWEPGARHGYHMLTFGWLVGEIVRRVSGESIGAFFAREFAAPLGLSTWIGLPASEESRVAVLAAPSFGDLPAAQEGDEESRAAAAAVMAAFSDPQSLTMRASSLSGAIGGWAEQSSPAFRAAEIPSVNGMTDARSLARLYAACVSPVDGFRALDAATIAEATGLVSDGPDAVIFSPTRYGLGFGLPTPAAPLLGPSTFGHSGMGGSLGLADAEHRVGFGYVMNKLGMSSSVGPRAERLIDALRGCLQ
jgi:CubicO group peptidase (beta-lactamase class C family)